MPEYSSKFLINTGELISLTSVAFFLHGVFLNIARKFRSLGAADVDASYGDGGS